MAPKKKKRGGDGLSQEERLQVLHAATGRMLDLLTEDAGVRRVSKEHPDEVVRAFLAGCQAGADAALRVLGVIVREETES